MTQAGVRVFKGKGSTEKLILNIANASGTTVHGTHVTTTTGAAAVATIVAPELSVFLSKTNYADTLVDFIMDIYDCEDPFEFSTQKHGNIILRHPCLTALFGATPISIAKSIPEKAHEAGYTSRILHVFNEGDEKAANPLTDLEDQDVTVLEMTQIKRIEASLVQGLIQMKQLAGPFTYTKEGKQWMDNWNRDWHQSATSQIEGYGSRRPDHLLRVAMLLRIAGFMDLTLDDKSLMSADTALKLIEQDFHKAFIHVGESELSKAKDRVVDIIRQSNGRISTALLIRRSYRYFRDYEDLKRTLQTLIEAGVIEDDGGQGQYWKITI